MLSEKQDHQGKLGSLFIVIEDMFNMNCLIDGFVLVSIPVDFLGLGSLWLTIFLAQCGTLVLKECGCYFNLYLSNSLVIIVRVGFSGYDTLAEMNKYDQCPLGLWDER